MQIINQRTATVPIESIAADPANPNQGDIGAISESIQSSGFFGHVLVQESTGRIMAGAHRHAAARALGATEIPVTYVDVDDERARRIMLADNRTQRLGADDPDRLATLLQELAATPAALGGTGYDGDALDELLADLGQTAPEVAGDPDAVPEVPDDQEPITKRGDIIRLGRHTLGCIDSTSLDEVRRLLGGVVPAMVLADPPYGMALDTDWSMRLGTVPGGRPGHPTRHASIRGDASAFDRGAVPLEAAEEFWFGADYYVDTLPGYGKDGSWFVWDKRQDGALDDMRGNAFELCWSKRRHRRALWRVVWIGVAGHNRTLDGAAKAHAAQKPVALLRSVVEGHSAPDAVIADPFAGSGSTLIACDVAGRTCCAAELDPGLCDVIVQRWQDLTGKTAVREQVAGDARVLTGT